MITRAAAAAAQTKNWMFSSHLEWRFLCVSLMSCVFDTLFTTFILLSLLWRKSSLIFLSHGNSPSIIRKSLRTYFVAKAQLNPADVMSEGCLFQTEILISPDVDSAIEQIVDYILRDYLFNWVTNFVPDEESFQLSLSIKIK